MMEFENQIPQSITCTFRMSLVPASKMRPFLTKDDCTEQTKSQKRRMIVSRSEIEPDETQWH